MSELKTLKDIVPDLSEAGVIRNELKQEAIKWIKELKNKSLTLDLQRVGFKKPVDRHMAKQDFIGVNYQIDWIKHFFNITEEDLK